MKVESIGKPRLENEVLCLRSREVCCFLVPGRISLCRRHDVVRTRHPRLQLSTFKNKKACRMNLHISAEPRSAEFNVLSSFRRIKISQFVIQPVCSPNGQSPHGSPYKHGRILSGQNYAHLLPCAGLHVTQESAYSLSISRENPDPPEDALILSIG